MIRALAAAFDLRPIGAGRKIANMGVMTRLIARLILAMLILPLSGSLFVLLMAVITSQGGPPEVYQLVIVWVIVYVFIAVYWVLLWYNLVRWTHDRTRQTIVAGILALLLGYLIALVVRFAFGGPLFVSVLFGGGLPPIAWVLATVLIWRETPEERMARITAAGTDTVLCPNCGYNMTGLREARCPECGSVFTIDQLLSGQPKHDASVLMDVDGAN